MIIIKSRIMVWGIMIFCLTAGAFAQSLAWLNSIDISEDGNSGGNIAFHDGNLYVSTFNDRKVLKITNGNYTTPTVALFADLSAKVTWPTGRGLQGIAVDSATGDVYVSGDYGAGRLVVKYNSSGAELASLIDSTGGHRNAGCVLWGSTPSLLLCQTGSGLFNVKSDLSGYEATAYLSGANSHARDVCVVGNNIYVSRTSIALPNVDGIDEFTGGAAGDLTGYAAAAWFAGTAASSQAVSGIYAWNYASATYLCWANQTTGARSLDIFNQSTKALYQSLGATENVTDARDSCVGTFGASSYLFVTNGAQNNIQVFGIDGATLETSVSDWPMY
ncbi:hypothetical protein JW926_13300 [Candidatus Sumerlaeota bacterium]|nr:hypothetical protein [Candidatus Sumerlaeota bacterium]